MASGEKAEAATEKPGGGPGPASACCSFCRKSFQEAGPLVEGPGEVYICAGCIDLFQDIVDQEKVRRATQPDLFAYFRLKLARIEQWAEELKTRMDPQSPLFELFRPGAPDSSTLPGDKAT
jgi:hypothetical protein